MRIALLAYLRPTERIILALLTLAILVMIGPIAFAQTAIGADVTPAVNWGFSLIQGVAVPVLLTATTAFTGVVAALLKQKLGLDATIATAELNKTLHAGIERGVLAMEAQFRDRLYDTGGKVIVTTRKQGVDFVIERTASLLPETLEKLGVSATDLRRLASEAVNARISAIAPPPAKAGTFPAGIV